ncbi:MAG: hypothetical protein WBF77_10405 [Sulfurimonadaceae bacterium]
MQDILKYSNLQELVPELLPVLLESIQTERLEIRRIDTSAEKFQKVRERYPTLQDAVYVIYSKFIKKCDHQYETFIFVNDVGHSITHISGRELALYGIIKPCEEFAISQEYADTKTS